jgi:hypothetical protein
MPKVDWKVAGNIYLPRRRLLFKTIKRERERDRAVNALRVCHNGASRESPAGFREPLYEPAFRHDRVLQRGLNRIRARPIRRRKTVRWLRRARSLAMNSRNRIRSSCTNVTPIKGSVLRLRPIRPPGCARRTRSVLRAWSLTADIEAFERYSVRRVS